MHHTVYRSQSFNPLDDYTREGLVKFIRRYCEQFCRFGIYGDRNFSICLNGVHFAENVDSAMLQVLANECFIELEDVKNFTKRLYETFEKEISRITEGFTVDKESLAWENQVLYCLLQNNDFFLAGIHDHQFDGHISGVYYLNVPPEGGDIVFYDRSHQQIQRIMPKTNDFFLFSSEMPHQPSYTTDVDWRVSINLNAKSTTPFKYRSLSHE